MNLEVFALCDAATDSHGKLNILGAFDCIRARQTPVAHPQCAVAARLRFYRGEEGTHEVRLNVVDADGKPIIPPLNAKVNIQKIAEDDSTAANLILNLHRVRLPTMGTYSVDLFVGGQHLGSLPFHLKPLQAAPPPPPESSEQW